MDKINKDLEEAVLHSAILTYPMPDDGGIDEVMKVQEARIFHEIGFIAGAQWQKEKVVGIIENRITEILGDAQPAPALRYELTDIIKRIKED